MGFAQNILMLLMFLTGLFMILLVLVQRGKGGGLSGAFGGMGGQSAFGTKAGDLFTRITIGVATFWILLCMLSLYLFGGAGEEAMFKDIPAGSKPDQPEARAPLESGTSGDDKSKPPKPLAGKSD
jgi:preprotein translocase subunit SecG